MSSPTHLARRFAGSLSRRPPAAEDLAWARNQLLPGELELWLHLGNVDRRHSIVVARRFLRATPDAPRAAVAAALLHDVGKIESGLGTFARVLATIVGPRGTRFRRYHAHEQVGVRMAEQAGSAPATLELLRGAGPYASALRAADDI